MDNPIRTFLVLVFAVATVGATLMMPWGELDMNHTNDKLPHTIKLLHAEGPFGGLMSTFASQKEQHAGFLNGKNAEGKQGDYVWGLALGAALLFGALAI
ncbi:MAG: hypothetical protein K2Z81_16690, partial [Cyanobacteria bacterium]|nr:hypothetical protein [Cyanobacteriota bacterium]